MSGPTPQPGAPVVTTVIPGPAAPPQPGPTPQPAPTPNPAPAPAPQPQPAPVGYPTPQPAPAPAQQPQPTGYPTPTPQPAPAPAPQPAPPSLVNLPSDITPQQVLATAAALGVPADRLGITPHLAQPPVSPQPAPAPQQQPPVSQADAALMQQNAEYKAQLDQYQAAEKLGQFGSLIKDCLELNNPANPQFINEDAANFFIGEMNKRFEPMDVGGVAGVKNKISGEMVKNNGGTGLASMKEVVEHYRSNYAWVFQNQPGGISQGAPSYGGQGGPPVSGMQVLAAEDIRRPGVNQALMATQQFHLAASGQPVNMSRVNEWMQQNGFSG